MRAGYGQQAGGGAEAVEVVPQRVQEGRIQQLEFTRAALSGEVPRDEYQVPWPRAFMEPLEIALEGRAILRTKQPRTQRPQVKSRKV
jgi:hypothetical protein